MVVVVVGDQYIINGWQCAEGDAGGIPTPRTQPGQWAGPFGPDRINQQVESCDLYQHAGVADHRDDRMLAVCDGCGYVGAWCVAPGGRRRLSQRQRSRSLNGLSVFVWPGLKKRRPSKWSLSGP